MKTVLYHLIDQIELGRFDGGYKVNGLPGNPNDPDVVELEIIEAIKPEVISGKKAIEIWTVDLVNYQYKLTWSIVDKTEQELIDELNQQAEQLEQQIKDEELAKIVETKIVEMREAIALLPDEEALEVKSKYKPYKVPMILNLGDKFYYPLNDKLYKVIGETHTTQLDWKPDTAVSLYEEVYIIPPGDVCNTSPAWNGANWSQYTVGYLVRHNNAVYEAKNGSHTWIAPAKTGDGAISWTWIKDCN